jgi:FAD/FMN-containing dehydrogenase/Fe-S oxidoreductase
VDRASGSVFSVSFHPRVGDSALAARLRREIEGDVLFDAGSRGRYATDASIYQIEPVGVVVPKTEADAKIAMQIAAEEGVPILPRGAGSSQCGQTVGAALVIDNSKYLNRVIACDRDQAAAVVQPGVVLDALNAQLRPHGLWFPVDVSTSAQATLGGMAGNNSSGSRSIRYGNKVHNVAGIDAVLADGSEHHFGAVPSDLARLSGEARYVALAKTVRAIAEREYLEIESRWPTVLRRVQGYNLDMVRPASDWNFAQLLVGSEGTLAYSKRIHLKLAPIPKHRTLGVCHFARFRQAMEAPQHIVKLAPSAVELVDRTMIGLARANAAFRSTVEKFITGDPDAILLVEFSGDAGDEQVRKLKQLTELMADLGHPGSVIEIVDAGLQRDVWEVRKAGLNIMMSMKGDGKPVSFIEDCAVPLEHLADYTERLTEVFRKHGTEGTWYAHASVGTLHVRPVLNMKDDGAKKMRAIAEEACALVRGYKGAAYSGEHGDGLVRSEWIAPILGARLTAALAEIKDAFDPRGLMNPGKIVRPPKQDDRTLFRYKPGYATPPLATALDWSEWEVQSEVERIHGHGFAAAVEMCNNNGHCRKFDAGTMCPSFRATGDERHLTRGRANTLRLALSGQLGPDGLTSDELHAALDLCVSCKGCKRECPTGVDMAKMKIEHLHHYHASRGYSLKDRLVAYLPRYAPWGARLPWLFNLRVPALFESIGFSAKRVLPKWRADAFHRSYSPSPSFEGEGRDGGSSHDVVFFADTLNNYFEPDNARAAVDVLAAGGYRVHVARPRDGGRPLCCGRTFLTLGMVAEAKKEARRTLAALEPHIERGVAIVGLEPSCIMTLRDEYLNLDLGKAAGELALDSHLLEEFLWREQQAGRLDLALKALPEKKALVHGHCHQKAFGAMPAVQKVLALVPGLEVATVESSCCGMAGSFGYEAAHYDVSMRMAERSLLPAVRNAAPETLVVADGASCRAQIGEGAGRRAVHVAQVLKRALA